MILNNEVNISAFNKFCHYSLCGNQLDFGTFQDVINQFLVIAITEINGVDFDVLSYNLKNLKILVKPKKNFDDKVSACYYPIMNKIEILDEVKNSDIYHELIHMSCCIRNFDYIRSGFECIEIKENKVKQCGIGINEGYTALLEDRYFSKFGAGQTYKIQQRIMKVIKYIIGKNKLEEYYFSSDVASLIFDLKNYLGEDRIMQLISALDFITVNNRISNIYTRKKIEKQALEINNILRELVFGYFDYQKNIDNQLIDLLKDGTCKYFVYKNKKIPLKQKSNVYYI